MQGSLAFFFKIWGRTWPTCPPGSADLVDFVSKQNLFNVRFPIKMQVMTAICCFDCTNFFDYIAMQIKIDRKCISLIINFDKFELSHTTAQTNIVRLLLNKLIHLQLQGRDL